MPTKSARISEEQLERFRRITTDTTICFVANKPVPYEISEKDTTAILEIRVTGIRELVRVGVDGRYLVHAPEGVFQRAQYYLGESGKQLIDWLPSRDTVYDCLGRVGNLDLNVSRKDFIFEEHYLKSLKRAEPGMDLWLLWASIGPCTDLIKKISQDKVQNTVGLGFRFTEPHGQEDFRIEVAPVNILFEPSVNLNAKWRKETRLPSWESSHK